MPRPFILLLLLLAPWLTVYPGAGSALTDSLKALLKEVPDTQKVLLMSDLCWEYRLSDRDSALYYGEGALALARKSTFRKGEAQALNDLGIILIDQNRFQTALEYFSLALEIRQEMGDSAGAASLYNKQGIIYQKQGNHSAALEKQLKALRIYEKLEEDRWISYSLNNIAIIHYNLGNLPKSLEYHQKALDIRHKIGDTYGIGASLGNMANVHLQSGDTQRALNYIQEAIGFLGQTRDAEALAVQLNNYGAIMLSGGSPDTALIYLNQALALRRELDDKKAIASTLASLGEVYLRKNQFERAEHSLNEALSLATDAGVKEEQINSLNRLAELYARTGRKDLALETLRNYIRLKDEVYNDQVNARILEMQTRYDAEKSEQQITLLTSRQQLAELKVQQQRTQMILLVGLAIIILGGAFFEYYRYRQKQKTLWQAEKIHQQELRMQAVIEAQENERKRISEDLHDGIGQTLSGLKMVCQGIAENAALEMSEKGQLQALGQSLDNACTEVRTLSHQMRPKALSALGLIPAIEEMLSSAFSHSPAHYQFDHYGVAEERLPEIIEVSIYRILQELVNNILKHSKAQEASFQLIRNKQGLVLMVEDNGEGFDATTRKGKGIGLLNLDSRVNLIHGDIHFESKTGEGTLVTIRIPL
jgi:signal transduction histidine kinase